MKIKGTVLEINSDTALVMTSDCDFLEIYRLEGLKTGQEIVFSRRDVVRKNKRIGRRFTYALVACLALFLLCMPVYSSFFAGTAGAAAAYVSIDISPGLELTVDDRSRVLAAEAFDQDGEKLLQSVPVQGKTVTEAISDLIKKAEEMNYVGGKDMVLICLTPAETVDQNPELLGKIGDKLIDYEKSNTEKVKVVKATNTQYQEARQMGMSAGRYSLWKDITNSDINKLEQFKNDKPANFLGKTKSIDDVKDMGFKPGNVNDEEKDKDSDKSNGNGYGFSDWNLNSNGNKNISQNGYWIWNSYYGSKFGFGNSSEIKGLNGSDNVIKNEDKNNSRNSNKNSNNNGNDNIGGNWNWDNSRDRNNNNYKNSFRDWKNNSPGSSPDSGSGFGFGNSNTTQSLNGSSEVKEIENKKKNEVKKEKEEKKENKTGNAKNKSNSSGNEDNSRNLNWEWNSSNFNTIKYSETVKSSEQNYLKQNKDNNSTNFKFQKSDWKLENKSNKNFMNKDKDNNKNMDNKEGNADRRQ